MRFHCLFTLFVFLLASPFLLGSCQKETTNKEEHTNIDDDDFQNSYPGDESTPNNLSDCGLWERPEGWFNVSNLWEDFPTDYGLSPNVFYPATVSINFNSIQLIGYFFNLQFQWQTEMIPCPLKDEQELFIYRYYDGAGYGEILWILDADATTLLYYASILMVLKGTHHDTIFHPEYTCEYLESKPPNNEMYDWDRVFGFGITGTIDGIPFVTDPKDRMTESEDGDYYIYLPYSYQGELIYKMNVDDCCPGGATLIQVVKKK